MSVEVQLFKRDAKGNIITWEIKKTNENLYKVSYGLLGKILHNETIQTFKNADKEIISRVNAKRKDGYKSLNDMRDNSPEFIEDKDNLVNYLNTYLPVDNTTEKGDKFCMLCKTLEDNKPFEKNNYFGQYKINGERCLVYLEKSNDLFEPIKVRYTSRKGTDWTDKLNWMNEEILNNIASPLKDMMIEEGAALDGEMYIPGYKINEINSIIKNVDHPLHYSIQYWIYDLAVPNMSAEIRSSKLHHFLHAHVAFFDNINDHLNNKERCLLLNSFTVKDISQATVLRNKFIDYGFEGLVIRDYKAEYQFGKRNLSMLKYKKIYDGYFTIVDIESQAKRSELPLFTLKNDINGNLFQATVNLPHDAQKKFLINKDIYIGKNAFVEYRERSGVQELPFHAKITNIITNTTPINEEKPKEKPKNERIIKKIKLKL